jgi:ABC-type uncharacterized transport system permease subunit
MTITLGWWLLPVAVSVCGGLITLCVALTEQQGGFAQGLGCLISGAAALIVSLAAWCLYFALN